MNCPRCNSEMAYEFFQDMWDDTGRLCFYGWRCIICGEILDPVIMSNRQSRPAPMLQKNYRYMASSHSHKK